MADAVFPGGKLSNVYAVELQDVYNAAPKAVLGAIAVSFATQGGDLLDEARARVLEEWWILHNAGIVPQRPPFPRGGGEF